MALEVDAFPSFLIWSSLWIAVLVYPPGSTEIVTAYRLNFLHGLISSIVAVMCLFNILGDSFTGMATISYFVIDFGNIILNDFYFRVKSYQTPTARKVEYFHHILCGGFGIFCELQYRNYCTLDKNPFIKFMLAELSTPFLIAWRYHPHNILGVLFAVVFFAVRIVYQGFILIPEYMENCERNVSMWFGIFYNLMNGFFMIMIIMKLMRKISESIYGKSDTGHKNKVPVGRNGTRDLNGGIGMDGNKKKK